MEAAKNSLTRILTAVGQLEYLLKNNSNEAALTAGETLLLKEANALQKKFDASMDDDFNTADAIAAIFELVKLANANGSSDNTKVFLRTIYDKIVLLCDILGLETKKEEELLDADIEKLIEERQTARKNKDFTKSDQIRDLLLERGIILEDTREGVKWRRS
jgi:cysteinyl-tRNA synthetase